MLIFRFVSNHISGTMPINNSDHDWELFGKIDPYYAVLTAPEFHGHLSGDARAKFFESGEEHIETMLSIIRERLDPAFAPKRARTSRW